MDVQQKNKWYFSPVSLIIGFLCVGPFVLPLVWTNPRYSRGAKTAISAVIIILSVLLLIAFGGSLKVLNDYYGQIDKLNF
ncbi:MAG: hypothetical protein KA022_01345 [Candidatus Omnitrophica bacterium]|jgi:hypothetical protein|nr:hypothetical protein [Candidatus Omnitrophota bacterium]MDD5506529.1 hypothetical protein [Candidatus Omnitrophota bacterium]